MSDHETLAAALVAALADLTVVERGRSAKIDTKGGGSFSYSFADLGDLVRETRPVLAEHGLTVRTPVHAFGDGLAVTVKFMHTSGETLEDDPFPFPHGHDARATGSMVTYHRRYALLASLGMATGEDDDGAAAVPRQQETIAAPSKAQNEDLDRLLQEVSDQGLKDFQTWVAAARLPERSRLNTDQAQQLIDWLEQRIKDESPVLAPGEEPF